jgi:actin related protein 2/3 complex subunit 2
LFVSSGGRPGSIDVAFVDFDGVRFHLSTPTSKEILLLSMNIRCWDELVKYGVLDLLKREYGDRLQAQPEADYNVSLEYVIESIPPPGGLFFPILRGPSTNDLTPFQTSVII